MCTVYLASYFGNSEISLKDDAMSATNEIFLETEDAQMIRSDHQNIVWPTLILVTSELN